MSHKDMVIILVIVIGLVLAVSLVPAVAGADLGLRITDKTGDGYWHGHTWEVDIYPGEEKSTSFTLYNPTGDELEVELAVEGSPNDGLEFDLSDSEFTLPSKEEERGALSVQARHDTEPGTYFVELEIKYKVVEVEEEQEEEEEQEPAVEPEPGLPPPTPPKPTPTLIPPQPAPVTPPTPSASEPVIPWWWFAVALSIATIGTCVVWLIVRKRREKKMLEEVGNGGEPE